MLLNEKKVLITGSTGDIGSAICEVFLRNGAFLFLTGTNQQKLDKLKTKLSNDFPKQKIFTQACDLSNTDDIVEMVKCCNEKLGGIDVLIGNAGINYDNLAVRMLDEQWQKVINVNLTANFVLSRECLKVMLKQKFGRIIMISSVVGLDGNIGQVNYSSSKAGLIGMIKTIATEYATKGITANCVAPGFIDTKMSAKIDDKYKQKLLSRIPMQKLGKAIDIANSCLFLASDMAEYITGETLSVNGGYSMK